MCQLFLPFLLKLQQSQSSVGRKRLFESFQLGSWHFQIHQCNKCKKSIYIVITLSLVRISNMASASLIVISLRVNLSVFKTGKDLKTSLLSSFITISFLFCNHKSTVDGAHSQVFNHWFSVIKIIIQRIDI